MLTGTPTSAAEIILSGMPKVIQMNLKQFCLLQKAKLPIFVFNKKVTVVNEAGNTEIDILKGIPSQISDGETLQLLYTTDINWKYVNAIKKLTDFNDDTISDWLNISVKTFREYKKPKSTFKENVKEQVLLILSLFKHGINIFGSVKEFENWLNQENFYFDNKTPASFLNTITGIKFIDDRLTAMEYGDNI